MAVQHFTMPTAVAVLLAALHFMGTSAKSTGRLAASDEFTSLWKDCNKWRVEQQALTCGMVWLNQTAWARSNYRITSVTNTASCSAGEQVRAWTCAHCNHCLFVFFTKDGFCCVQAARNHRPYIYKCCAHCATIQVPAHGLQVFTELVRMPEGQALSNLFDSVCDGVVSTVNDFAKHVDLVAEPSRKSGQTVSTSDTMAAADTVFLIIRNECSDKVTVTVTHDIDLVLTLPMRVLKTSAQVR
jgi:ligand-binding sensor protein